MTDRELEELLADLESDRAERKASEVDKDKLKRTICAQRFGFGIPLAMQELSRNGSPPAELQPMDTHVLVTLKRHR